MSEHALVSDARVAQGLVKGIVLAGGEGKRLRPLSYYFQKCMIPIGNVQKPLLEYIIRLLKYHGIIDIAMLVGYKHEQIVNYFNNGRRFGVELTYMRDDPDLKGTGGSVLNVYRNGLLKPDEDLVVYYGDIVSNVDLSVMLQYHRQRGATATLALSKGYQVRVGVADVQDGDITSWREKPQLDINVGIGVMILRATAIHELDCLSQHAPELDLMSDLIPYLIRRGETIGAYLTDAFWYDVGSAEMYEKLDNGLVEQHLGYLVP